MRRKELERECNAAIKLIMSTMETMAESDPAEALEPTAFNEQRRVVIRKVWNLFKQCIVYDPRGEPTNVK